MTEVCRQFDNVQLRSAHFLFQSSQHPSPQISLDSEFCPSYKPVSLSSQPCFLKDLCMFIVVPCVTSHSFINHWYSACTHHPIEPTLAKFTSNLQIVLRNGKGHSVSYLTFWLSLTKVIPPAFLKFTFSLIPRALLCPGFPPTS